eukprot:SM000004S14934  [mRNA]  locus=s4:379312:380846:+ [translate_table: standard]
MAPRRRRRASSWLSRADCLSVPPLGPRGLGVCRLPRRRHGGPSRRAADGGGWLPQTCLLCRERGHQLKDCPKAVAAPSRGGAAAAGAAGICYNCGAAGHRLAACPDPPRVGGALLATCFTCGEAGHLSRDCSSNPHGVYPKGGCCKVCGKVSHLAKDCPSKLLGGATGARAGSSKKLQIGANGAAATAALPAGGLRHTFFASGDDLEDDFREELAGNSGELAAHDADDDLKEEEGLQGTLESGSRLEEGTPGGGVGESRLDRKRRATSTPTKALRAVERLSATKQGSTATLRAARTQPKVVTGSPSLSEVLYRATLFQDNALLGHGEQG